MRILMMLEKKASLLPKKFGNGNWHGLKKISWNPHYHYPFLGKLGIVFFFQLNQRQP
jgi:hypothetical protein